MPDIGDYPVPEPEVTGVELDGLYSSDRDYLEQLEFYKIHQRKA